MFMQRKIVPGLILCFLLFSTSVPLLSGIQDVPSQTFGRGNTIIVSQTAKDVPLDESMADSIQDLDFVQVASPEVFSFSVLMGEPVVCRGVILDRFLEIEGGRIIDGNPGGMDAVVGRDLAERLGIGIGSRVTFTGSVVPVFLEVNVGGIYGKDDPADDVLLPLPYARKMVGLSDPNVLTIRIVASDKDALVDYLKDQGYSLTIGWYGEPSTELNENTTEQERIAQELAIKYANKSQLSMVDESLTSIFVQRGSGSVSVVVLGFIVLNGLLSFIGITGLFAKTIIEKQGNIGILSAIGATRSRIQLFILRDVLATSVVASTVGLTLGFSLAYAVGRARLIVAFGQTVVPNLSVALMLGTLLGSIGISCLSGFVVSNSLLRSSPALLMRGSVGRPVAGDAVELSEVIGD